MKKALIVTLIASFLFSVSARPVMADDRRSDPAAVGIVMGGLAAIFALTAWGANVITGKREETNQLAVKEGNITARKQIDVNLQTSALYSGVTEGQIDSGHVTLPNGDQVSRLKIEGIKRELVQVSSAPAPIREQTLPQAPQQDQQRARARCNALPPPHADKCFLDAGVRPW